MALRRAYKNYQLVLICWLAVAGYWSPEAGWSGWVVDISSTGWNCGMFMAPKLTSFDVFGMLLKYWLSTEDGFVGGENDLDLGYVYPGWTGQLGHQWILDEKYPGTVPCAQSPIWMLSPLLQWLGKQTPWEP